MSADALIYSYRTSEDRERMARYWCERQYNGDTQPEILQMIQEDLEAMNHVQLAYLHREAGGEAPLVKRLADDYDPWR